MKTLRERLEEHARKYATRRARESTRKHAAEPVQALARAYAAGTREAMPVSGDELTRIRADRG